MFSRTTLTVHWCSTVFTDVTSLTISYPRNIASIEFNTTMALVVTERDFVGEGFGQSCGCETAEDDQH